MSTAIANYLYYNTQIVTIISAPTGVSAIVSGTTATVSFTPSFGATSYTATSSPGGLTGTSTSSPITVSGLAAGTYTFTVVATNATGTSVASTPSNPVTTYNNIAISNVSFSGIGGYPGTLNTNGVTGTAITNGVTYNVYTFLNSTTSASYTVTYSCAAQTTIYVLAVGGGGGGNISSGGGAGGVVMMPVTLPAGINQTITVSVGSGGAGTASTTAQGNEGSNTTVTFSAASSANILAGGGGAPGGRGNVAPAPSSFGSSGGHGWVATDQNATLIRNGYNNYANIGGMADAGNYGANGGGAGTSPGSKVTPYSNGGDGIRCFLPGIRDFPPSTIPYGTYYWGGGGGSGGNGTPRNGGLGGGGGGASPNTNAGGTGGGSALNAGSNGGINGGIGGNAGANTGGGGGGSWSGYAGNGGSGIVVISFPQNVVTTSTMSTLTNASLSAAAYSNIKGAYACKLVNYNYYGPIFTLRHSADTSGIYTKNFYADTTGANIGDDYLGTGTSLSSWLSTNSANTTYAYVTKWYNQGMDASFNCATQYTMGSQPIYEVDAQVVNFGYQGIAPQVGCFLTLPDGSVPYNTYYSWIAKSANILTTGAHNFISCGGGTSNATSWLGIITSAVYNGWWANEFSAAITYSNGGTHSIVASNSSSNTSMVTGGVTSSTTIYANGYYNGTLLTATQGASRTGWVCTPVNANMGKYSVNGDLNNGQVYNMYWFNAAISNADRGLIEYPDQVLPLPPITGTTGANTLIMTANTTTVSGITGTYNYMNGSYIASSSSYASTSYPYNAFDNNPAAIWHCQFYNSGSGSPSGVYTQEPYNTTYQGGGTGYYWTTVVSGQTVSGEWLQIQFPYTFLLTSYAIFLRTDSAYAWSWKSFVVAGSNNGTTWTSLDTRTYGTTYPITGNTFAVPSPTTSYSYYRFIITQVATQTNVVTCGDLRLFGNQITVPAAPTSVTASATGLVSFVGSAGATKYIATSSPGGMTGSLTSSASGTLSISVAGLTNGTSYTFTVVAINAAGTSAASTASSSVVANSSLTLTLNNFSNLYSNGAYTIYAFKLPGSTTTISVTGATTTNPVTMHIFAVGGGGSGGCDQAAGGGGGGVVQSIVNLTSDDTIGITVGDGGTATATTSAFGVSGANTTVNFSVNTGNNITAYGGGGGASYGFTANTTSTPAVIANSAIGSGGGGTNLVYVGGSYAPGGTSTTYVLNGVTYNQGYAGGIYGTVVGANGGGGGAGGTGGAGSATASGAGGVGVQINTSVLSYFSGGSIDNKAISSLWWAGGGGGGGTQPNITAGSGGKGGGGAGSANTTGLGGTGDTNGLTSGASGTGGTFGANGGAGATNTGGGGGGTSQSGALTTLGGKGGSGIVLIAIPNSFNVTTTLNSFAPSSVSGLTLWLDGHDNSNMTRSGDNVLQWNDKSGGGYHFTQSNTTYTPVISWFSLNGRNMLNFTSSKYMNNTTCPMGTNYTIFAVGYTSVNGYGRILNGSAANNYLFLGTGTGVTQYATFIGSGSTWNDSDANLPTASVASACIMEMTNNGTSTGLIPYVNGTAQTAKNGSTASFTGFVLGSAGTGASGTQPWGGYVAEVLIYNSVLSTAVRQKVEGYLAWKWGLVSSLPLGHPYLARSPDSYTNTLKQSNFTTFGLLGVSGCQLWLDAADTGTITANYGAISLWNDKSTNGYNFTGTSNPKMGTYTQNRYNVMDLNTNSGSYFLNSTFPFPSTGSVFTVAQLITNNSSWQTPFRCINNGQALYFQKDATTNTIIYYYNNDNVKIDTSVNAFSSNIMCETYNNSTLQLGGSINGTALNKVTSTGTTLPGTGILLGNNPLYNQPWRGTIAEVIVYNSVLSDVARQMVEGYLAWKWGLQAGLPLTHSYYAAPPSGSDILNYQFRVKSTSSTVPTVDATGNYTITNTASVAMTSDSTRGYVFNLTGANSLSIAGATGLTGTNCTRTMWVKAGVLPSNGNVFSSGTWPIRFLVSNPNCLGSQVNYPSGTRIADPVYEGSGWVFYAFTTTATSQAMYVNGGLTPVATSSTAASVDPTTIYFGANSAGNYFTGQLDDMRQYNYVLTPAQIQQVYNTSILASVGVLDSISSSAKAATIATYAFKRCFTSYTGPAVNVRRVSDSSALDFYADAYGNVGTTVNGTGTSIASWLTSTTGYVTKWYDQSGKGSHLAQSNTSYQPTVVLNDPDGICVYLTANMPTAGSSQLQTATTGVWPNSTVPELHQFIVVKMPTGKTNNMLTTCNNYGLLSKRATSHVFWSGGNSYWDAPLGRRCFISDRSVGTNKFFVNQSISNTVFTNNFMVYDFYNGTTWSTTRSACYNTMAGDVNCIGMNYSETGVDLSCNHYVYAFSVFQQSLYGSSDRVALINAFNTVPYTPLSNVGLMLHLEVAPQGGTVWADTTGNGNHGTIVGAVGYPENGITISSKGPYISSNYYVNTTAFTYSVVGSFNPSVYWASLFANTDWAGGKGYNFSFTAANQIGVYGGGNNGAYNFTGIPYNTLILLDFVINGSTVTLYKNGTLVNSGTFGLPANGLATNSATTFGGSESSGIGTYYNIRMYNYALTAAQVTQNYNILKTTYAI